MAKTTISAKIDPDRLARLDRRVADLGITRTSAIESAVDAWLEPRGPVAQCGASAIREMLAEDAMAFTLDGAEPEGDPDQPLLDLAAQPPSNPWGI